jgi:hypothetical protein
MSSIPQDAEVADSRNHGTELNNPDQAYRDALEKVRRAREERAIARGTLNVFIAHQNRDYATANEIACILKALGTTTTVEPDGTEITHHSINPYLAENKIEPAKPWRRDIATALDKADFLILLFPQQNGGWAWCHAEAGFFRGRVHPDSPRVIVLHPRGQHVPDPLSDLQAVEVQPITEEDAKTVEQSLKAPDEQLSTIENEQVSKSLFNFFKTLLADPPYKAAPPINPDFITKDIYRRRRIETALRLRRAIGRCVVDSIVDHNILVLKVPLADLRKVPLAKLRAAGAEAVQASLENADVHVADSPGLSSIFGIGQTFGPLKWKTFAQGVLQQLESNGQLANELQAFWSALASAIVSCDSFQRLFPITATFRSPDDGKLYIPAIEKFDRRGDGTAIVTLRFVRYLCTDYGRGTPLNQLSPLHASTQPLLISLELANRFRWEVIDGFGQTEEARASERALSNLRERLEDIETKARQQGMSIERLLHAFGSHAGVDNQPTTTRLEEAERAAQVLREAFAAGGNAATVARMLEQWRKHREAIETTLDDDKKSIEAKAREIKGILDAYTPVTNRFISLISRRLSEVMETA